MPISRALLPLLATLLLTLSCSRLADRDFSERFRITVENYQTILRWGGDAEILAFHVDADGNTPILESAPNADYRILKVDLLKALVNDEKIGAQVVLHVEYERLASSTIGSTTFSHIWIYNEEKKLWKNSSPFPLIK
ncbi:MAG: hypothetical protein ACYYK0_01255 [Candidatus Eutrophobiaceae bacterium]